ncbi:hypothetical protein [Hymenobacter negativus]|uniref:Uncharacterized protein n=1 Tax=Hymenobacter negativus TaxID=2795026 RepID=A0ABS0Q5I6_9BACT|nr:hypothetical protein [Hymenobacter negativus]MBH8557924.1 hypothetical protein [Hymenobacter negativus]
MKRHIGEDTSEFTPAMRAELSRLKALVASGQEGDGFPWAEYRDLQGRESRATPKRSYYAAPFNSKGPLKKVVFESDSVQLAAVQDAGLPTAPDTVSMNLAAPSLASARAKISKGSAPLAQKAIPSLESLCKGQDDKQRAEYAAKIDAMWEAVKNKTIASSYPTACAAVYKLADWLGLVHKDIPSREWKAMLLDRYQVTVSEAIGKYQFENPPKSRVFREAVRNAFAFAQLILAPKAKQKPLPGIYQQLPVYTENGKGLRSS